MKECQNENGILCLLNGFHNELSIDINNENFHETPKRVARAWREMISGEIDTWGQVEKVLNKSFPSDYKGMVIVSDVESFGVCPHHLLTVNYMVNLGYIPSEKVLGISKLVRIVDILSRRLVLQETLTSDITKALQMLSPQGTIVQVYGKHGCMGCRGVRQPQVTTMTSDITGTFTNQGVRDEFSQLVRINQCVQ